ncbi:MAG: hypothetical protein WCT51_04490 [Candidatus Shapirobacteria bacterium]|jgi:hypothetical protein
MINENKIYKLGMLDAIYLPNYDLFLNGEKCNTITSFLKDEKGLVQVIRLKKLEDSVRKFISLSDKKITGLDKEVEERILGPCNFRNKTPNKQFYELLAKYNLLKKEN